MPAPIPELVAAFAPADGEFPDPLTLAPSRRNGARALVSALRRSAERGCGGRRLEGAVRGLRGINARGAEARDAGDYNGKLDCRLPASSLRIRSATSGGGS